MSTDINFYFNLVCSIGGIAFFIYSLIITKNIKALFPASNIIRKWVIIQILIVFFLLGYIFNILFLALDQVEFLNIMVALVYIFGGLFVALIINLSYKTYKTMILDSSSEK